MGWGDREKGAGGDMMRHMVMGEGRREWGMKAMMEGMTGTLKGSDGRLKVGGTEDGRDGK